MSKDRVVKLLVVRVVDINSECMRRAHLPQYTSQDILRLTMDDVPTWNVFRCGWTQGINQCQGASTTENLKIYKPTQLRDLSAFVAAIRPGFKSMLSKFLQRSKFAYNVDSFDSILKNDSSGSSWLLYQEDIMHCLNLAGIEMSEAYKIIKAISKKKVAVINSAKEQFLIGFKDFIIKSENMNESEAEAACEDVWRVIIDAASYSFNAAHAVCVSLDALYGAYLKAHYPMEYYSTLLDSYNEKGNKEKVTEIKQEMRNAFGIEIVSCRFRQDNRSFYMDKEKLQMADALSSVKFVSKTVANELYKMRNNQYDSFISLLCDLDSNRAFNSRSIIVLIRMGYFSEFGSSGKLFKLLEEFMHGKNKITKQLKDATRNKRLATLKELERTAEESEFSPVEQIVFESEYYGSPISVFPNEKGKFIVLEVETKYTPRAVLYSIATGNIGRIKILKRDYNDHPFDANDIILIKHHTKKQAYSYRDGEKVPKRGVYDIWVNQYSIEYKNNEEE